MSSITIQSLEATINRCHNALPSTGTECKLHPDLSALAELYGVMIYFKRSSVELSQVTDLQRQILTKWRVEHA